MVFDQELCLLFVAGPGTRLWDAEREVVAGRNLQRSRVASRAGDLGAVLSCRPRRAWNIGLHWADTGLELHLAAVPIPNLDGEVDQLMVLVTDVTQSKADEAAREQAEDRYRTAFEAGPVGMSRTALSGRFEAVNEALCVLTGYTAEQLCASDFLSITHSDDIEPARHALASMVSGLTDVYRTEKRFIHADGHDIWVALSTAIVRDNDDRPLYFLSHYPRHHRPQALRITAPSPRRARSDDRTAKPAAASSPPSTGTSRPSLGTVNRAPCSCWISTISSRSTTRSVIAPATN